MKRWIGLAIVMTLSACSTAGPQGKLADNTKERLTLTKLDEAPGCPADGVIHYARGSAGVPAAYEENPSPQVEDGDYCVCERVELETYPPQVRWNCPSTPPTDDGANCVTGIDTETGVTFIECPSADNGGGSQSVPGNAGSGGVSGSAKP